MENKMIRISNYQSLDMGQLKSFAHAVSEKYGQQKELVERVSHAECIDDAVLEILRYETQLYEAKNEDKEKISNEFEKIFISLRR